MKQPLVGLYIAFCLGILVSSYLKAPFLVFYPLACLFLISSLIFLRPNLKFTPLEKAQSFKAGLKEENKLFRRGLKLLPNFLTGFTSHYNKKSGASP